jgi:tetratricopeptide (TPR) repeat protein
MAYCYAQQVHRLATPSARALALARDHARLAEAAWRAAITASELPEGTLPHPLIPYTYGLVTGVNEAPEADGEGHRREERLLRAARYYYRAVELDPGNGMFYNNLGWTLLKLTEWDVPTVPFEVTLETLLARMTPRASRLSVSLWAKVDDWEWLAPLSGSVQVPAATASEAYLRHAVQLQPNNKLTHANLALLYSTPHFRERDAVAYLIRARYHGRKAVQLDGGYVNGYRDLAVALIRYGLLDEAKELYDKALELADDPEKDQELIRQVCAEVERAEVHLAPARMRTWRHPRTSLLEPRPPDQPP